MSSKNKLGHVTQSDAAIGADDRRHVCRYAVAHDRAWLGWWVDLAFQSTAARIVDISLRGCRLTVEEFPLPGVPVWFCPPGANTSEWIEAKLVETKKRFFGPKQVRISFRKNLPYEQFKDVIYGPAAVGGTLPSTYWAGHEDEDEG
jgi:hypothetical protein